MARDSQHAAGAFVVLEGIDGSGKTSVARSLAARLTATGREVVLTREPGGTGLGEAVRSLVLGGDSEMDPVAELLLFSAARAQHVAAVIQPALERGEVVICDRYTASTLAYQWGGRGVSRHAIAAAQELATGGCAPDLTMLLDLPVAVAQQRRFGEAEAVNRFDEEATAFHQRVRSAYLTLAAEDPLRWRILDAEAAPDDLAAAAWAEVNALIEDRNVLDERVAW
ncbi:MAG: dTMP kinase [Thermomicrobiales bacterium]